MKLHLGCGTKKLDDFINIDILSETCDIKLDITNLNIINNNIVKEIYVCHVLEHFKRNKIINLLLEWNRVLINDGTLRIAVPDFEKVVKVYNKNKNITELIGLLNGGQKNEYDIHYINYDFTILKELLESCGFDNIKKYDCEDFLCNKDDYSKAYLPHMDKNGELMSLNIICTKSRNIDNQNISLSNNLIKFTTNKLSDFI